MYSVKIEAIGSKLCRKVELARSLESNKGVISNNHRNLNVALKLSVFVSLV